MKSGGYAISHCKVPVTSWAPDASLIIIVSFVFCLSGPRIIFAGELIQSDVTYHDGVYLIDIAMDIRADIDKTRAILLDYGQTTNYNENIVKSELLSVTASGKKIGRVEIRDCLLFFCRNLVQIQEMDKLASGAIRIHVLPENSDYRTGDYLWRFIPRPGGMTRLLINAVIAPKIRVPPVLGPFVIARKLKQRLINVVNKLENLSQHDNM